MDDILKGIGKLELKSDVFSVVIDTEKAAEIIDGISTDELIKKIDSTVDTVKSAISTVSDSSKTEDISNMEVTSEKGGISIGKKQ